MKATIFFADTQVKEAFEALRASTRSEDRELVALLERAFVAIIGQRFLWHSGSKEADPEELSATTSPPIKNLWKYNLSRSWRLMYTVTSDGGTIAVVIEWLDHTGYDRRFGY